MTKSFKKEFSHKDAKSTKKKVVHLGACPRGNHDRAENPKQLSLGQRPRTHNKYKIFPAHGSECRNAVKTKRKKLAIDILNCNILNIKVLQRT
jgi:hypothetical protein